MNHDAQAVARTVTRPNRILIVLAAAWMAAAIALGGVFTSPSDAGASAPGGATQAVGRIQP
jgi:hypothetical protein